MIVRGCRSTALAATLLVLTALAGPSAGDDKAPVPAATPAARKDKAWQERHKALTTQASKGDIDIVFLGDSLTQGWESSGSQEWKKRFQSLKAANFGMAGDRTENVLWRVGEGKELQGLKPRLVVLLIGTNNLGSDRHGQISEGADSAADIAEGVAAIVRQLRADLPTTRVLLLGVLPRAAAATAPVRAKISDVNARLAKLGDGKQVQYLDVGPKLLDKDGLLSADLLPDTLHLSPAGYAVLADALLPAIEEQLKKRSE
jgi:lysophospholipase L1-like esterase